MRFVARIKLPGHKLSTGAERGLSAIGLIKGVCWPSCWPFRFAASKVLCNTIYLCHEFESLLRTIEATSGD